MPYLLALLLAAVFAWAGAAKLVDRAGTAASFSALGVSGAPAAAVVVPLVELAVAAALVIVPVGGAVAAIVTLLAFSAFLVTRIRSGVDVPCRCFGAPSSAPVGWATVARNGALAALALVVIAGS